MNLRFGMVLVACLLLAKQADAQDKKQQARELFEQGLSHYNLAEYDKAIDEFKQSYALSRVPLLLFNIGQAYRLKGDCVQAMRFYKNYLRDSPRPANKAELEAVSQCEKTLAERPTTEPKPAPVEEKPVAAPPTPTPPVATPASVTPAPQPEPAVQVHADADAHPGRTKRIAGLATAGAGVALVGVGIVFGLQASSASDEINQLIARGGMWTDHYRQVDADGQSAATTANVMFALGGAAIVGGAVLYYLGLRDEGTQVSVAPVQGGVAMVWSCVF